jgi:sulfonate transport system permease protein
VTLLITWEFAVRLGLLPGSLIPRPSVVVADFMRMLEDGTLLVHAGISLFRLLTGFFIGSLVGISCGTLVGRSRRASALIEPTLLSVIPIPAISWIPILIVGFGIGEGSKIALIAVGAFSMTFIQTAHSTRNVDPNFLEVARVLEKRRMDVVFSILLPSALPNILAALRIALALSWGLVIAAELIASTSGLGWLIWAARNFSRSDDMVAGMITAGLIGKTSDAILAAIGRYLAPWTAARDKKSPAY